MTRTVSIRPARNHDLAALVKVEQACFASDILSRRSFQRFIRPGAHDLLVAEIGNELVGYVLVLYRTGTSLARLYSIAVPRKHQRAGIALQLTVAAEHAARERHCALMRLEVNTNNDAANRLYEKLGYRTIGRIDNYYDDGGDAFRMEKRIYAGMLREHVSAPYYGQTTDFSCGPAALMMAMNRLDPKYQMNRQEELHIWREATTIFMTSGHGGCSPHGLALSAWKRGFGVKLYINQSGAPFLDGVRDPDKKAVIELVHRDFVELIKETGIQLLLQDISPDELERILRSGHAVIALISTWRLNRNKAPHWVFIAGADKRFVYINDPDSTDHSWQSETDYVQVPINIQEFINMACFGRTRLRCLLVLDHKDAAKAGQSHVA